MTKEACKKYLERMGYLVVCYKGCPSFSDTWVADGHGWGGYHNETTLNALYKSVKNYLKTHPVK